jgi:hypothetical protein
MESSLGFIASKDGCGVEGRSGALDLWKRRAAGRMK